MRVFSQGRLAQRLAQALIVAFVWSALCSGLAVLPADAQIVTRGVTSQSVAVVAFQNLTDYCPDTFGATAADAVALELGNRLLLDVLPNQEVALQLNNLGMSIPLTTSQLVRLAAELEVGMIVTGDVREVSLVEEKGNRYVELTLGVLLFDRMAEGYVNGALVTARSPASAEFSEEELVTKALKQAVFQAVQEMKTRPTITAVVLWAKEDRVFTNTGTRGGVAPGLNMAAIRDGQRIANVRITSTEATGSYGSVMGGMQLRTGDHLRALFEIPVAEKPTLKTRLKRESKGWEKPLLIGGVLLGLAGYATASRTLSEGDIAAPRFTVSDLANQLSLPTAYGVPLMAANVLIDWKPYNDTQKTRIAGYELFRDGALIEVFWREGERTMYVDDDAYPMPGMIGTTWLYRALTVDPLSGNVGHDFTYDNWIPDENGNPTFDDWLAGLPFIAALYGTTIVEYGFIATPVIPGVRHVYQIRPVLIENHQLPDSPLNNWEFIPSDPHGFSSTDDYVTPVCAPATDQALVIGNVATFLFYGPLGADEMVLQVTRDTGAGGPVEFPSTRILQRVITSLDPMDPTMWPFMIPFSFQSIQVSLNDLQALPGTSNVFWWRVGARNRNSAVRARPWPLDLTDEYGWVWSYPVNRVQVSGVSRAGLTREQQDRVSLFRSNRVMKVRVREDKRPMHVPR